MVAAGRMRNDPFRFGHTKPRDLGNRSRVSFCARRAYSWSARCIAMRPLRVISRMP